MNGIHDLGGMEGLGPVAPAAHDGPTFSADWERGIFAILPPTLGAGLYHLDDIRYGLEQMPAAQYLASRYYEHWVYTVEKNLVERGHLTSEEYAERIRHYAAQPDAPLPDRSDPEQAAFVMMVCKMGASCRRDAGAEPKFSAGDQVRVRNYRPSGHTRLAGLLCGQTGVVELVHGHFAFPDSNQVRDGEQPQPVYNVSFPATALWGEPNSDPNQSVQVDLWESYLEPV